MQPMRRRNSNNYILCGPPAKKVPEPPVSNDDSNKPSILKALEAVVAAGRRGLLGPTAMAAVEAIPDLDPECCGSKVGQETPSFIPLVEEQVEEQNGRREREKEEENKEEKEGNSECNTVAAVTPTVKGTGSCEPTEKDVWICGDAVISLLTNRAQSSCGLQLGFPQSAANVIWRGINTMVWDDLLPILHKMYHQIRPPSIIIIHLGESDLLTDNSNVLVIKMQNDLCILQRALPHVDIIWSSLLPKHIGEPSENSEDIESDRNNVNCRMEEYCNETGICYLSHPLLTGENKSLFLPDGTLSTAGADIFIADLEKVLNPYLSSVKQKAQGPDAACSQLLPGLRAIGVRERKQMEVFLKTVFLHPNLICVGFCGGCSGRGGILWYWLVAVWKDLLPAYRIVPCKNAAEYNNNCVYRSQADVNCVMIA